MLEHLEGFTSKDSMRINELVASNFEGATPEDIELYARWKSALALVDDEAKRKAENERKEIEARIEIQQREFELREEILKTELAAAKARWEAVKNG